MHRSSPNVSSRHGFTLVELSIVLAIIGLLVGGILAGQSLIRASEIRSIVTDFTRYQAAINTFHDKYRYLPGDFPDATKIWGLDPNGCPNNNNQTPITKTCDGDGNGTIGNGTMGWDDNINEGFRAWQHLSDEGLIAGIYSGTSGPDYPGLSEAVIGVNVPRGKINNTGWSIGFIYRQPWAFMPNGNYLWFGYTDDSGIEMTDNFSLTPLETYNIDKKMDDGKPGTGKIMAVSWYVCSDDTVDSDYMIDNPAPQCTPYFSIR
jgi:prepilin-type N-terminal cleavage/methylation domain-containing protein